jgi:hypothetical protein
MRARFAPKRNSFRAIELSQLVDLCPSGKNGQSDQQHNVEVQEKLSPLLR